jgi:hypothetical protein
LLERAADPFVVMLVFNFVCYFDESCLVVLFLIFVFVC